MKATPRKHRHLTTSLVMALSAIVVVMCMCTAAFAAAKPVYGGKLVVAVPADPDTVDPHKYVAAATGEILYNIFEGLVSFEPDGTIVPALATSWDVSDDGKTYTFDIRKDVVFHNGKKLTSADVLYSYERMIDKTTGYPRDWAKDTAKVEAPSDYKFVATLNKPSAPFLADIVDAAIIPKDSGPDQKSKPIGTGAFKLTQWLPGQELKLTRNDNYWRKGLPYLDNVTFRIIADQPASLIALKAGAVDVIPRVTGDLATDARKDKSIKTLAAPMNLVQLAPINLAHKPFGDIRVRQAINYAIDKDALIEGAAAGLGTKLGSNMSPAMGSWYVDLTGYYKPNIAKAKELLKEAGYPQGFSATITLPSVYDLHVQTGELIAAQLAKVGIDLKVELVDWATWLDKVYTKRDYDITVIGFDGKLDPALLLARYESTYARNFFNYKNAEFDTLVKKGEVTSSVAERRKIYQRLQTILAEDVPAVFIMDPSTISALRSDVQGWTIYSKYVADVVHVYLSK